MWFVMLSAVELLHDSVRAHGAASRCSQQSDKPIGNWHDQLMNDPLVVIIMLPICKVCSWPMWQGQRL